MIKGETNIRRRIIKLLSKMKTVDKTGLFQLLFVREDESSNDVRVFARFGETTQAEAARKALDKRFFDGRNIIAESYDQALFEHGDYTG